MATVALITGAALVGVGVLAVQANGSAPDKDAAATVQQPAASPNQSGQPAAPAPDPLVLPADSGTGKRIVYRLSDPRVWLVGADGKAQMTAQVVPGTENPTPGTYQVSKRYSTNRAGDRVAVQYQVLWGPSSNTTAYAFDAVASLAPDKMPDKPSAGTTTGGVRLTQNDALAIWQFANLRTKIVVVK